MLSKTLFLEIREASGMPEDEERGVQLEGKSVKMEDLLMEAERPTAYRRSSLDPSQRKYTPPLRGKRKRYQRMSPNSVLI